MKFLLGPIEIAGYLQGLQEGLQANGHEAEIILVDQHPFDYESFNETWISQMLNRVTEFVSGRWCKALRYFVKIIVGLGATLYACFSCDAVILVFGTSYLPRRIDLKIFRWLGVRVMMVYLGSDSRPEYLHGAHVMAKGMKVRALLDSAERRSEKLCDVSAQVDFVIDNPMSGILHKTAVYDWFQIGFPVSVRGEYIQRRKKNTLSKFKIVHCPSKAAIKGSAEIRDAIRKLIDKGHNIEYVELSGVSRSEVLKTLGSADLAIDQLFSDTPVAGFANECCILGVPVIVGSNSALRLRQYFEKVGINIPTIFIHPDDLFDTIISLLRDPNSLITFSQQGYSFIHSFWAPSLVAERIQDIFLGRGHRYLVNSRKISDLGGLGASQGHLLKIHEEAIQNYPEHPQSKIISECLCHEA